MRNNVDQKNYEYGHFSRSVYVQERQLRVTGGSLLIIFTHPGDRAYIEHIQDVHKISRTSPERLMYDRYVSCVEWVYVHLLNIWICFREYLLMRIKYWIYQFFIKHLIDHLFFSLRSNMTNKPFVWNTIVTYFWNT